MIPRRCKRCGEPVWVWPWQNAYCRDFERCISTERVILIEHAYRWEFDEPAPLVFEQPPDDLDLCSRCMGFGSLVRKDWESGPVYVDCDRCGTTGKDPSLCPA